MKLYVWVASCPPTMSGTFAPGDDGTGVVAAWAGAVHMQPKTSIHIWK
jgi:hypothetical protein